KAKEIGLSLILSPLFGFGAAALLMWFLKDVVRSKALFHIPQGEDDRPPILIRILLFTTCTLVSFFHGSNDGQKGVGLLMLIMIAFLPAKFAVDRMTCDDKILVSLNSVQQTLPRLSANDEKGKALVSDLTDSVAAAKANIASGSSRDDKHVFNYRKEIQAVIK